MKTQHQLIKYLALLFFFFIMVPPLLAEDEDEEEVPYPTRPETLAFLKERVPLAITLMERVREEEGEREYQEVLKEAVEQVFEYREFLHHDGKAVADLHLQGVQLELEVADLTHRFHDKAETDAERETIRTALKAVVKRQIEHEKKAMELELKEALQGIEELKGEIRRLNDIGEEALNNEVNELLEEDDEDEGEDEEEDEE